MAENIQFQTIDIQSLQRSERMRKVEDPTSIDTTSLNAESESEEYSLLDFSKEIQEMLNDNKAKSFVVTDFQPKSKERHFYLKVDANLIHMIEESEVKKVETKFDMENFVFTVNGEPKEDMEKISAFINKFSTIFSKVETGDYDLYQEDKNA